MKIGLCAGSYDPLTLGHEDVFKQAAELVDKLIILVSFNKDKKGQLGINDRLHCLKNFVKEHNLTNVEVMYNDTEYTVKFAERHNVNYLFRGLRNSQDLVYEENVRFLNNSLNPNIKTVYLPAGKGLEQISSSLVRSLIGYEGWEMEVRKYVSPFVLKTLMINKHKEELSKFWHWDGVMKFTDKTSDFEVIKGSMSNITSDVSSKWFNIIIDKYSETHRMYHNLEHISRMLRQCKNHLGGRTNQVLNYDLLKYAIFFHDIIYDPKSKTNEVDSANLFKEFSEEAKLSVELTNDVIVAIIQSANHMLGSSNPNIQMFLDLDMFILCSSESLFSSYCEKIRQEYSFVPDEIYNVKRSEFLASIKEYPLKSNYFKNHEAIKLNFKRNFKL